MKFNWKIFLLFLLMSISLFASIRSVYEVRDFQLRNEAKIKADTWPMYFNVELDYGQNRVIGSYVIKEHCYYRRDMSFHFDKSTQHFVVDDWGDYRCDNVWTFDSPEDVVELRDNLNKIIDAQKARLEE